MFAKRKLIGPLTSSCFVSHAELIRRFYFFSVDLAFVAQYELHAHRNPDVTPSTSVSVMQGVESRLWRGDTGSYY